MESSTSKTMVNVLIVTAILLIGISVASVLIKKPTEIVQVPTPPKKEMPEPVVQEPIITSTTTESTTTEIAVKTSTSTISSPSTIVEIKGFTGKKWTWTKTSINKGTSTLPKKVNAFTVTFNATGTLTGTTDCNNFFGTYKVASNTLTFGPFGATKMFCEGSQEGDFMKSLQGVMGYSIDKTNNLILTISSGTMMFK